VLRPQLRELWRQGTLVAAIACVIARETGAANGDAALVTGLLHNVGRLFILERVHDSSQGAPDMAIWEPVMRDWHALLGRAILQHWKFAPNIVDAVGDQDARDGAATGSDRLTDVLIVATSLVPCVFDRALLEGTVPAVAAFRRLGFSVDACNALLKRTAQQITALRDALAG
jgi:HD-like signal output (HDOD) protein